MKQRLGLRAERDGANAAGRGRHQDRAEGTLAEREANALARAARLEGGRCHPEPGVGLFVEAPGGAVARTVDRLRHVAMLAQLTAHAFAALRSEVGSWRDTRAGLEQAVRMKGAQADAARQGLEGGRALALFEVTAH